MENSRDNRDAPAPGVSSTPPIGEAGQSTRPTQPNEPPKESIKETIESILIAFILAFVFRAFVVEAFVIPSGSMAPTLLGAHMRFRCQECGYDFTVNYPASRGGGDAAPPSLTPPIFSTHCPNCGFKVQREGNGSRDNFWDVYYGDRILVLKYLYLLQDPQRWDVVVFKSPTSSTTDRSGHPDYATNFIKRLVGKPGETVMILDGDVYVKTRDHDWTVQTKTRTAQDALWRVVYDNDFYPRQHYRSSWTFPWQQAEGSGWSQPKEKEALRILSFNNLNGSGTLHFDEKSNEGTFPLSDWLPYNETMRTLPANELNAREADAQYRVDQYARGNIPRWYVSDLKVQFNLERKEGDGPVRVGLTKLGHTFTAELLPGAARVLHTVDGKPESAVEIGKADLGFAGKEPLRVEFSNVDYRVTLRVNDRDVIVSTPQQYKPDVHTDSNGKPAGGLIAEYKANNGRFEAPRVTLGADRMAGSISHLSLWRDVYYTPGPGHGSSWSHGSPETPIELHTSQDKVPGTDHHYDNEYFVLGDNSVLSGDARSWTEPVRLRENEDLDVDSGRVPERFLLGKAFFVYWPAGYRPFSSTAPGIIPNFGAMRFIH